MAACKKLTLVSPRAAGLNLELPPNSRDVRRKAHHAAVKYFTCELLSIKRKIAVRATARAPI